MLAWWLISNNFTLPPLSSSHRPQTIPSSLTYIATGRASKLTQQQFHSSSLLGEALTSRNTSPLFPPLPLSSLGSAWSSSASHSQHLRFICGIVCLQPAPCVLITAPFATAPTWAGPQTCLFNSTASSHHRHIHHDNHTHRHPHNHFPETRRCPSRSRSGRPDVFLLGLSNSGTMG